MRSVQKVASLFMVAVAIFLAFTTSEATAPADKIAYGLGTAFAILASFSLAVRSTRGD